MTREELLAKLAAFAETHGSDGRRRDTEMDHCHADEFLLAFINDPEVTAAFNAFNKWYA